MANVKISDLTSLAEGDIDTSTDVVPIVDASEGKTKKSTSQAVVNAGLKAPGPIGNTTPGLGTFTSLVATSLLGYATGAGAGGTVTQTTSISTGVTINKVCGNITTYNQISPIGPTTDKFTVTNSAVSAGDIVLLCLSSAGTQHVTYSAENVIDGYFDIRVRITDTVAVPSVGISFAVFNNATS